MFFLCAPGGTLAFYLFKCKHFKADHIPCDTFLVNQNCLPFPPPIIPWLPALWILTRKCFIVKQEKKHFLAQRKCSVMLRKTNYSIIWCFLNVEVAHLCWTETWKIIFTYVCLNPFEMYEKFICSSKCNDFKHSTFLGHSLFKQSLVITVCHK